MSTFTAIRFVCEAIPPAYTAHLGEQLLAHIGLRRRRKADHGVH